MDSTHDINERKESSQLLFSQALLDMIQQNQQ